jgi:hypothetical protein
VPAVLDLAVIAVAVGAILLLRLVGGSLPWGHLLIAVGPDGRPMRPRVKWHLWSVSMGESPRLAAAAGLASMLLGVVSLAAAAPWLAQSLFHPVRGPLVLLLTFIAAVALVLLPLGLSVLVRAALDLAARRCSMVGTVVGMRRDRGLFGRSYHIAVQAGDRLFGRNLWADSFKVDRLVFERLSPGDRLSLEYSPHLRFVYAAVSSLERPDKPAPRLTEQAG